MYDGELSLKLSPERKESDIWNCPPNWFPWCWATMVWRHRMTRSSMTWHSVTGDRMRDHIWSMYMTCVYPPVSSSVALENPQTKWWFWDVLIGTSPIFIVDFPARHVWWHRRYLQKILVLRGNMMTNPTLRCRREFEPQSSDSHVRDPLIVVQNSGPSWYLMVYLILFLFSLPFKVQTSHKKDIALSLSVHPRRNQTGDLLELPDRSWCHHRPWT